MAAEQETRRAMRERYDRLLEYVRSLMAVGFKAASIVEKAMEVSDPAPLFVDRSNRESCGRIVRKAVRQVEDEWSELQAKLHPHATGTYLAKKTKFESSLWPLATARVRVTVREYVVEDQTTGKKRRVKETLTEGPHPIVQAAAIRELGRTLDDVARVLGVDVNGKIPPQTADDELFRTTTDELLQAHEERRRTALQESAITVQAKHVDDDESGGPRGGTPDTSVDVESGADGDRRNDRSSYTKEQDE
jgi:hypothetical protein